MNYKDLAKKHRSLPEDENGFREAPYSRRFYEIKVEPYGSEDLDKIYVQTISKDLTLRLLELDPKAQFNFVKALMDEAITFQRLGKTFILTSGRQDTDRMLITHFEMAGKNHLHIDVR